VDFGRGALSPVTRRARRWIRREINRSMFPEIRPLALAAAYGPKTRRSVAAWRKKRTFRGPVQYGAPVDAGAGPFATETDIARGLRARERDREVAIPRSLFADLWRMAGDNYCLSET
jgi:hypothetical protein